MFEYYFPKSFFIKDLFIIYCMAHFILSFLTQNKNVLKKSLNKIGFYLYIHFKKKHSIYLSL